MSIFSHILRESHSGGLPTYVSKIKHIEGLEFHYKLVENNYTLSPDSLSNNRITSVIDLSGNGRHLNNLSGINKCPTFLPNAIDGKAAMDFGGTNDERYLDCVFDTTISFPYTVFVVHKTPISNTHQSMVYTSIGSFPYANGFYIGTTLGSAVIRNDTNNNNYFQYTGIGVDVGEDSTNKYRLYTNIHTQNAQNLKGYINTVANTNQFTPSNVNSTAAFKSIRLGAFSNLATYANTSIVEIFCASGDLSANPTLLNALHNYILTEYPSLLL